MLQNSISAYRPLRAQLDDRLSSLKNLFSLVSFVRIPLFCPSLVQMLLKQELGFSLSSLLEKIWILGNDKHRCVRALKTPCFGLCLFMFKIWKREERFLLS